MSLSRRNFLAGCAAVGVSSLLPNSADTRVTRPRDPHPDPPTATPSPLRVRCVGSDPSAILTPPKLRLGL